MLNNFKLHSKADFLHLLCFYTFNMFRSESLFTVKLTSTRALGPKLLVIKGTNLLFSLLNKVFEELIRVFVFRSFVNS